MNEKKYFGAGSFHFSLKNKEDKMSIGDYQKNIEECLSSKSDITNLKIEFGLKKTKKSTLNYNILLEDLINKKDKTFFPIPYLGQIIFDLKVPFEFQKSVWPGSYLLDAKIENFKVRIIYDGILPIAFVMPIRFSEKYLPHTTFMLVREYLKKIINLEENYLIEFVSLGNPLLSVECYLEPSKGVNNSPGWDFYYNKNKVPNEIIFGYSTTYFRNYEDNQDYLESVIDSLFKYKIGRASCRERVSLNV